MGGSRTTTRTTTRTTWCRPLDTAAVVAVAVVLASTAAACTPQPPTPAPTRLDVRTLLTVCGGVIPPPGQPWCRTNPTSRDVEIRSGRDVVATGTTDATGRLVLTVPPGRLTVGVSDANPYEACVTVTVSAVANTTTPVTQTCTINAP